MSGTGFRPKIYLCIHQDKASGRKAANFYQTKSRICLIFLHFSTPAVFFDTTNFLSIEASPHLLYDKGITKNELQTETYSI